MLEGRAWGCPRLISHELPFGGVPKGVFCWLVRLVNVSLQKFGAAIRNPYKFPRLQRTLGIIGLDVG